MSSFPARDPTLRLPGLDGLRAIALIAVMLFHADITWAQGGYLGVDVFFVISGFIITSLLVKDTQDGIHSTLFQFYWRRAKRLLPASYFMVAAVVLVAALGAVDALPQLRGDATASLFYATNWELIWHKTSYFEAMGRPPLLQHLWSLAIEEQFYVFWAPIVLISARRLSRRGIAALAALMAVASVTCMAVSAMKIGSLGETVSSRLYFGTDTHGFPLLIGATLGLLWNPRPSPDSPKQLRGRIACVLGLGALVTMLFLFGLLGEQTAWLYPWGFLLSALTSALLVLGATCPGSPFGRWLDTPAMRWTGERSYGMYLWHWPIFMLTRPGIDVQNLGTTVNFLLRIALTVSISALSYEYLEKPIRHGAIERLWRDFCAHEVRLRTQLRFASIVVTLSLMAGGTGTILYLAPSKAMPAQDVRDALDVDASAPRIQLVALSTPSRAPENPVTPAQPAIQSFSGNDLTAVGDSVLLGSSRLLNVMLPGTDVHATVGWQAANVIAQIKELIHSNQLRPAVLIHLGTNGYVTEDQLRKILFLLSDRKRVVLVNTHVPRQWMNANNALFDRVAPEFPNLRLANWRDVSEGQPGYFVSDGVHLTVKGQRAYIAEIMRAGHFVPQAVTASSSSPLETKEAQSTAARDQSIALEPLPHPMAPDAFWEKIARCETGLNWQHSGRFAGGLGIYLGTWAQWGGREFAPTPAQATAQDQIEVANRISTQGWKRPDGKVVKPVGFQGWGCLSVVGRPPAESLFTYTPQSVISKHFYIGERDDAVRNLEILLGLSPNGLYDAYVRSKHRAYLKQKGLPEIRAGAGSQ
ncbi:acyltransferase family protein [Paraburkholderia sp. MM5482-R1]|uniref:acyltransferase family protein n=1 Tax=unclassified Paraburkholderia TaxID=2615204 RepID=UPI003D209407